LKHIFLRASIHNLFEETIPPSSKKPATPLVVACIDRPAIARHISRPPAHANSRLPRQLLARLHHRLPRRLPARPRRLSCQSPTRPCRMPRHRPHCIARPASRLPIRLSALMDLYIHPLYVLVSKILSSILNSPAPIHPLYPLSTLSTVGLTCHFI
jgi:hypothetical protein